MTTFTWTIDDLSRNTDDGGVFTAYWKCVATDGVNTVEASGSQSFIYDASSSGFVSYVDLTEQIVLSWLSNDLRVDTEGGLSINVFEAGVADPASGLPW